MALLAVITLLAGLCAGAVVVILVTQRLRGDAVAAAHLTTQAVVSELRSEAAAERDAAVRAALEQLTMLNGERMGSAIEAGRSDLDAKKGLIEAQLESMRAELGKVTDLVGTLERARERSYGQLTEQLAQTAQATGVLTNHTQALREALASSKARGQWGERMADDVLRMAGFVENVNYRKQKSVEGGRAIPDFTFDLPKGHVLYMDAKFPVSAYLRYLECETDAERATHCASFLRAVRQRVKDLTSRDYAEPGTKSVDYVLLFIPNESIYSFIHEHDLHLLDDALAQKVVFCSPLTLFAMLAVIRQAFDNFVLEQTSDEILRLMGAFHAQYDRFSAAVDTVGRRMDAAQKAFEDLNGTRRRALEKPLGKIDDLRRQRGLAADPLLSPGAEVLDLDDARDGLGA